MGFSSLALWWELEELGGFEGSYIFGIAMQIYELNARFCLNKNPAENLNQNPPKMQFWKQPYNTHSSPMVTGRARGTCQAHPNFTSNSEWVIIARPSLSPPVLQASWHCGRAWTSIPLFMPLSVLKATEHKLNPSDLPITSAVTWRDPQFWHRLRVSSHLEP